MLKFTLKHLLHVSAQSPSSGSVLFERAKVIVIVRQLVNKTLIASRCTVQLWKI